MNRIKFFYAIILLMLISSFSFGQVIYVNDDAGGANNGSDWTNAYTDLQAALAAASSGDEIWVAEGTYKPTATANRDIFFVLKDGVSLYGGFNGTETAVTQRVNFGEGEANETILSGDIGTTGVNTDNSKCVVYCNTDNANLYFDGFTVTKGYGGADSDLVGPGLYFRASSGAGSEIDLEVRNCVSKENTAVWDHAGFYADFVNLVMEDVIIHDNVSAGEDNGGCGIFRGTATLNNVVIRDNTAKWTGVGLALVDLTNFNISNSYITGNTMTSNTRPQGGGVIVYTSSGTMTNCVISGNYSQGEGGGIYFGTWTSFQTVNLINCTITGNRATTSGGGIYVDNGNSTFWTINLTNTVVWNNQDGTGTTTSTSSIVPNSATFNYSNCLIQGMDPGGSNLDGITNAGVANYPGFTTPLDPATAPSSNGDFSIGMSSPLVAAGTATGAPATDILGDTRNNPPSVGAYGFLLPTPSVGNNALNFDGPGSPDNPAIGDYVVATAQQTLSGSFTVEGMFKADHATNPIPLFSGRSASQEATFDIQIENGNQVHSDIGNGGSWLNTSADIPFNYNTGQWYHLAYVMDYTGGTVTYTVYIDGAEIGSNSFASGSAPVAMVSGSPFHIGCVRPDQSQRAMATFDEIRIWDHARTQCEIIETMNTELVGSEGGLVAYYNFNYGTAAGNNAGLTILTDETGNENHGTLTNMALTGATSNWVATGTLNPGTSYSAGAWSNGVPDANTLAIINDNYSLPTDIVCDALWVNSGNTLSIQAGNYVTIDGCLTNDGTLELASSADMTVSGSLITNGAITNNGTMRANRYLHPDAWHFVSSPLNANVNAEEPFYLEYVYTYDEAYAGTENDDAWTALATGDQIQPGVGYLVMSPTDWNSNSYVTFEGTFQTGNFSVSNLPFTNQGYNLVANPYPSAIDINTVGKTAIGGTSYIWNSGGNAWDSDNLGYATWDGGVGTFGRTKDVPPMQAFIVQVTNATNALNFDNADRLHSAASYRNEEVENLIRFITLGNGYSDEMVVYFAEDNADSRKLFGPENVPSIYTLENDEKMVINKLQDLRGEYSVPMGFVCNESGEYTIKTTEYTFDENSTVVLEDTKTGTFTTLVADSEYTFAYDVNDDELRFVLHFNKSATEISEFASNLNIYAFGKSIFVKNIENQNGTVLVYNALGQQVLASDLQEEIATDLTAGLYVVKVVSNGVQTTQKVIIK